ncbi:phosphoribosylanthranilate isomerase [Paenibacillus sp. sgz5001063]|uniref:phosphoribosylanthranilate isomerase n=1 Tax=Paenibacillus sp. sgz5001063 TaxID=3242474 RepID=UPI0036D3B015
MAETVVKICGLQDVEVLKSMKRLPLDYIGFVFAESRRKVSPEQAAELTSELAGWENGKPPLTAGVFVNPSLDELDAVLSIVPLSVIQLHGQESADYCRAVKAAFPQVLVWKALSVAANEAQSPGNGPQALQQYAGAIDALLLDTYDPAGSGGLGRTFEWDRIPAYQQAASEYGLPLLVAGGLHPDNVRELLDGYAPYGVDVSSGVETDGMKDIVKITAFVERVKQS